jgi:hypothetical protein
MVSSRLPPAEVDQVDDWALLNETTRSDAIRRLIEIGLKAARPPKSAHKVGRRSRAAELAANTIKKLIDPAATSEERAQRRRRLTKGPTEFREDRVDLPKPKK